MRNSLISIMAAALIAAIAGIATPAAATTLSQAQQMCKKNPQCSETKTAGGSNFGVGKNEVWCPNSGPCQCVVCQPTRVQSEGLRAPIKGVLSGSAGKSDTPRGTLGGGTFGGGLLDTTPGLYGQGPAAAGTPGRPAAPSAPPVIIR